MKLLMLEDNRDRIAAFRQAVTTLPAAELQVWRDAPAMLAALPDALRGVDLISLDHDLVPDPGEPDPGDGLQVALALAACTPCCPIILHSTNVDRVATMTRELVDAGWAVHRVAPIGMGDAWIQRYWLPTAVRALGHD